MFVVTDATISELFDLSKGEQRILQLVNACVSHEMRNPLNALIAQLLRLETAENLLRQLIRNTNDPILTQQLNTILTEITQSREIQSSCSKLLTFYVEDLLCLAQIDKGTFRKNISTFRLQDAIDEVVRIQAQKAEFRQITVEVTLDRLSSDTMVTTDMMRLQQVILSY